MTSPSVTEAHQRRDHASSERTELGRYRTADGVERVFCTASASRTSCRVTDVPVDRPGRAYLVERGLEQDGYAALLALVQDYLEQANKLGVPPMSTTARRVTRRFSVTEVEKLTRRAGDTRRRRAHASLPYVSVLDDIWADLVAWLRRCEHHHDTHIASDLAARGRD